MYRKLVYTFLLCCSFIFARAQAPQSNFRSKMVSTSVSPVKFDSLSIVPHTVRVAGVHSVNYKVDEVNSLLFWVGAGLPDSVRIEYRVFPFSLITTSQNLNYDSIRYFFAPEKSKELQTKHRFIDFGDINYHGSFGRGISFGNNQDAVVNSSLNLQLNGFIGDSMEISAAISDQTMPLQPQGNTRQINDFDQIFIQLKKGDYRAEFGDIDMRQTENYFLRFYKRLQGAAFYSERPVKNYSNRLAAGGAIARGKFTRNQIVAIEGNQGPYKLSAPNGELYFSVLAGTERVFLDGQLLRRGDDADYVIDYNLAEITFTAARLITRESRIQVEFENSDRN